MGRTVRSLQNTPHHVITMIRNAIESQGGP